MSVMALKPRPIGPPDGKQGFGHCDPTPKAHDLKWHIRFGCAISFFRVVPEQTDF